uniref:Uncharacterized protein n=1 Tax=Ornithorhynchus anatinus TaxID=9258 RepID=A0A6I8NGB7_ORNAN
MLFVMDPQPRGRGGRKKQKGKKGVLDIPGGMGREARDRVPVMDNSSGLLNPLASPALLVMASSSEAPRGPSPPCPQPHPFGVPLNLDKPAQVPFLGTGYSLMYSPPEHPGREYPSPLLPLTFGPPSLEQAAVGMLGYGALYPFTPFPLPEELGSFLGAKQLKSRYLVLEKDLKDQRDHGEREPGPGLASLSLRPFQASSGPRPSQSKKGKRESPQPPFGSGVVKVGAASPSIESLGLHFPGPGVGAEGAGERKRDGGGRRERTLGWDTDPENFQEPSPPAPPAGRLLGNGTGTQMGSRCSRS